MSENNSENTITDEKYWGSIKVLRDECQQYRLDQDCTDKLIARLNDPNPNKVEDAFEPIHLLILLRKLNLKAELNYKSPLQAMRFANTQLIYQNLLLKQSNLKFKETK